jgi:hypothetical protein
MRNRLSGKILLWSASVAAWITPVPLDAVTYNLQAVRASDVTVGFACDKCDVSNGTVQPLLFAVASSPSLTFSVHAYADSAGGRALAVTPGAKGWAGTSYLQWFSIAPVAMQSAPGGTVAKGTISIALAAGMIIGQKPYVKNGVLYMGKSSELRKSLAVFQPGLLFSKGVKISVEKDGLYKITGASLRNLGVPIASVPGTQYKLYCNGIEVPICVSNSFHPVLQDGDEIYFYGKFLRGAQTYLAQFSNTNVYWLTWEGVTPGIRVSKVSGAQKKDVTVYSGGTNTQVLAHEFRDTIHLEQDNQMLFLGNVNVISEMADSVPGADSDDWYWGIIGRDAITDFQIDVPSPTLSTDPSLSGRMHVRLQGMSNVASVSPNHRFYIYLNDNVPGTNPQIAEWNGQAGFDFYSDPFPSSSFANGSNKITFSRVPLGSGQQAQAYPDLAALNWIEIEYYRTFAADSDRVVFKNGATDVDGIFQFQVKGFSAAALDLWDISNSRLFTGFSTQSSTTNGKTSYTLVFQDSLTTTHTFYAQTTAKRLAPARMSIDTVRRDWSSLARADYVIITVDSFIADFKPLADAYAKKGLTVAIADISSVYDAFSGGVADPESIRTLLNYLVAVSPDKHPRYLLLGGDTSHDLDKANRGRNVVPTHLSRVPGWGPASDDGYFASFLGDDDFPDICVGRFPAENRVQLRNIVSKTVGYITGRACGPWHDNLLLVGGAESDFTAFNDNTETEVIGPAMNVYRLDGDPSSRYYRDESNASKDLAGVINAGVYAVNFNGHGGGLVWSDSRFFSYSDLDKLYNGQWDRAGRLPIAFSFTCLTGDFESVDYPSLGEEFLRLAKNGDVGFFGASGYTSKRGNMIMNRLLLQNAVAGSFESVGDLLSWVKINMLVRFGAEFGPLVRQYNFLGDPALPWALAPDSLRLTVAKSALRPRDTLAIKGYCAPVHSGQARVTVGADFDTWNQFAWNVRSDSLSGACPLKDSLTTSRGIARAFAWNDSQEVRGSVAFSRSTVLFKNVAVSPSPLRYGDSATVWTSIAMLDTSQKVDAVACLWAIAPRYVKNPVFQSITMAADSTGRWKTGVRIPIVYDGMVGDELLIKFRAVGTNVSDTTDASDFSILGRPDLTFAKHGFSLSWLNDSLSVQYDILNAGNASAPPFTVTLYADGSLGSPMALIASKDSLSSGKVRTLSVSLPDTQGTLQLSAVVNPSHAFEEISSDNNIARLAARVTYRDEASTSDTLCWNGRAVCVSPVAPLSPKRRVFLYADTIGAAAPLRTESYWPPLSDDSVSRFMLWSRPALLPSDSFSWVFHRLMPDTSPAKRAADYPASARLRVMLQDNGLNAWRSAAVSSDSSEVSCTMRSSRSGPFALGLLSDNQPPQIRVSVNGRELTFLDYAAKGKPFNISLTDASGVVPATVKVLLDRKNLDSALVSGIPVQSDMREVSCTAYPKKESAVDSLTIIAEDFAGNSAASTFAYMPGEELAIKNFSCHPNPFTAKQDNSGNTVQTIRFAFLLTDVAQSASLTVYTIGSRAVWKWQRDDGIIGYQEVPWDGKTSQGYRIANGTYYAKLVVTNGSKRIFSTIRIAKLEGY